MSKGTTCCGLIALEQMAAVKTISMFSLIHLAKDNGLTLYFCKVEPDELMSVHRPAIFHQRDHFVFVENGNPMPPGEYDGYVLTPKPLHEPLPFTLARRIKGGGPLVAIGPIMAGVWSVAAPIISAAAWGGLQGAAIGGLSSAFTGGNIGKGMLQGLGFGALTGGIGGALSSGASALAGGGGMLGKIGQGASALMSAHPYATSGLIGAGVGALGVGGGPGGFSGALQGAMKGAAMPALGDVTKGLVSSFSGGASALAGGGAQGAGVTMSPSAGGVSGLSGVSPAFQTPGVRLNSGAAGFGAGVPGVSGAASLAGGAAPAAATGSSSLIPGLSNFQLLGMGASTLMKPPTNTTDMSANFTKAAQYLGGENYKALPTATRNQLNKYTNMSIGDLSTEFMAQDDKSLRLLADKKKAAINQIVTQYANYGQDPYTSTEAQQKLTEINRQYDQSAAELQQNMQNQATQQAIDFKKEILSKSIQQNEFDYNSFMELATYYGFDQQAKYAMEAKDYDALQQLLAEIFSIGQYDPRLAKK